MRRRLVAPLALSVVVVLLLLLVVVQEGSWSGNHRNSAGGVASAVGAAAVRAHRSSHVGGGSAGDKPPAYAVLSQLPRTSTVPEPFHKHPKVTAVALHKSGSMFVHNLFALLAKVHAVPMYSYCMLDKGVCPSFYTFVDTPEKEDANDEEGGGESRQGAVLATVRHPEEVLKHWCCLGAILIGVRDPRDILVSQYFSYGWTHRNMSRLGAGVAAWQVERRDYIQRTPLEAYVRNTTIQQEVKAEFSGLMRLKAACGREPGRCFVYSYLDMVTNFSAWFDTVCNFVGCHEGRPGLHEAKAILHKDMQRVTGKSTEAVRKQEETTMNTGHGPHARHPEGGDWKRFSSETQAALASCFREELEWLRSVQLPSR